MNQEIQNTAAGRQNKMQKESETIKKKLEPEIYARSYAFCFHAGFSLLFYDFTPFILNSDS